jgi:PIN domain nuclease of toxin-antitoxin system
MPQPAAQPVLDASALLAYLGDEPGADTVADTVAGGANISTVNLAEVLSTLARRGADPVRVASELADRGLLGGAITVESFTSEDAVETARLRPLTHAAGLSLADRACLALAHRLAVPAVSADQAWAGLELAVEVRLIREQPQRPPRRRGRSR